MKTGCCGTNYFQVAAFPNLVLSLSLCSFSPFSLSSSLSDLSLLCLSISLFALSPLSLSNSLFALLSPLFPPLSLSFSPFLSLSLSLTSIAQLIKASDYACTGRYPVQTSAIFLNEFSISLSLVFSPSHSLYLSFYLCNYIFLFVLFPLSLALSPSLYLSISLCLAISLCHLPVLL